MIYDRGAYCNTDVKFHPNSSKAAERLRSVWERALSRRIGPKKNVNGFRILLLYTDYDSECVYPAQLFQNNKAIDGTFAKK